MIRLEFTAFDVEEGEECKYDSVTVFDGENTSMTPLATLCGSSIPPPITSSESAIVVRFESDASSTATGFSIKYTTLATASSGRLVLVRLVLARLVLAQLVQARVSLLFDSIHSQKLFVGKLAWICCVHELRTLISRRL